MSLTQPQSQSTVRAVIYDWQIAASAYESTPETWLGQPALAGLHPSTVTNQWWFTQPSTDRHKILHALMVLAREGDEFSTKTVIALFLYFVTRRCSTATCLRNLTLVEAQAVVLPALWEALTRRNPPKDPSMSTGTLILNTMSFLSAETVREQQKRVEEQKRRFPITIPTDPAVISTAPLCATSSTQDEVAELLAWALDTKTLTPVEVRVLTMQHLLGLPLTSIETELGIKPNYAAKMNFNSRRKLKAAVKDHIATWGTW